MADPYVTLEDLNPQCDGALMSHTHVYGRPTETPRARCNKELIKNYHGATFTAITLTGGVV